MTISFLQILIFFFILGLLYATDLTALHTKIKFFQKKIKQYFSSLKKKK